MIADQNSRKIRAVHVWVCSYTNGRRFRPDSEPSTAKSIFHRMVAQELLREKQRPELADISKTIYPALEEIFRDHENYLAKIFQIYSTA